MKGAVELFWTGTGVGENSIVFAHVANLADIPVPAGYLAAVCVVV